MVTNNLTRREREVLELVRLGLTNEEIAQRLGITLDGAKYHVSQILSKLGVATREEAAELPIAAERPRRHSWLIGAAGAGVTVAAAVTIAVLAWGTARSGSGDEAPDMPDASGEFDDFVYHGRGPFVGDHWHVMYGVFAGGRVVPPFPGWESGIHTHGTEGDGIIHLHPFKEDEAGQNASIARFIEEAGGLLTETELRLPDGQTFRNGDLVNQRPGKVLIIASPIDAWCQESLDLEGHYEVVPPEYVPLDGQCIRIVFTYPEQLERQYNPPVRIPEFTWPPASHTP